MAKPSLSAASMTSLSRMEPPGWITAVIPPEAPTSIPSENGKKASEARTPSLADSPAADNHK